MAPLHLRRHRRDHVVDVEGLAPRHQLAEEDHLKEQIPQLLAQRLGLTAIDGVDHLEGLFDHVGSQALGRLFAVPGASVLGEEAAHQIDQAWKRLTVHALGVASERALAMREATAPAWGMIRA